MWLGAKVAAVFVLLGGLAGILVAWTTIFVSSLVDAVGNGDAVTPEWLGQFVAMAPLALIVGIALGLLPAALTSCVYVSGQARWRRYAIVAAIGGTLSALEGLYLAAQTVPVGVYPFRFLSVVAVLAAAGEIAAMTCHRLVRRWPEFEPKDT